MQFSEQWLREWVNPELSTTELVEQLTMAGLEVDGVEPAAPAFTNVLVGQILSREQHPDADKLGVCQVDVGEQEPLSIVCGAANAVPGMKVPVAVVGAVLPGDFKIKKAKLRGVPSFGMLCAEQELGLAEESDGLWALPEDAPVGKDIRDYLALDDQIIEVDLTPNRGDCLGMLGLAREVAALNDLTFTAPTVTAVSPAIDDVLTVSVQEPASCPRYLGRVIRRVDMQAKTPDWMVEKLRRGGVRSIDPVVDVTNFVLQELGQPMHAFDLGKLSGAIDVRKANPSEKLTLLDGQEIELQDDTLVIADKNAPLAIAGIMGGLDSAVTAATQDILLECAFFAPIAIAGKARNYGLHTDSSHRFERGVDYQLQHKAMERATWLLLDIAGGEAGPVTEVVSENDLPNQSAIELRQQKVEQLLGVSLTETVIEKILNQLGLETTANGAGQWLVSVPSFRFDISIEADLIEELGRVYGYNRLPTVMPKMNFSIEQDDEAQTGIDALRERLVTLGYQEAISYSFVEPSLQNMLEPDVAPMRLLNPISEDLSVMRTSLWAGLLQAAAYNKKRQQSRIRLFETGLRFVPEGDRLKQEPMVAGLLYGSLSSESWSGESGEVDFFDVKGDVEALLGLTAGATTRFVPAQHSALHPGQSAKIWQGEALLGWLGQLHPQHQKQLGLGACYLFELKLDQLLQGIVPAFAPLSRFPEVRRDIAVLVDEACMAEQVVTCIKANAGEFLTEVVLFDLYQGDNLPKDKKSLALGLTFQHPSRTLTEEDINTAMDVVILELKQQVNGVLRD